MSTKNNDLAARLLFWLHKRLPSVLQFWSEAMLAELSVVEGFWNRLQWSLGSAVTLLTSWARLSRGDDSKSPQSREVTLIAAYQFLFSMVLVGLMIWQLPRVTEPWQYAFPVLIMCFALALLPGILGFGLMLRDDAARVGTQLFSLVHGLFNLEYIRRGLAPHPEFTAARILLDIVIILVLQRHSVRRIFELSPIRLDLRGSD